MARLIWTKESRWWLREIYSHISADKPEAARRVVRGIFEKAHLAVEFPDAGYSVGRKDFPGLRALLYGQYRIVYQAHPDGNVYVLGVFHGALDLKRHLRLK